MSDKKKEDTDEFLGNVEISGDVSYKHVEEETREEKDQANFEGTFFNPDFHKGQESTFQKTFLDEHNPRKVKTILDDMKTDDLVQLLIEKLSEKTEKKTPFNSKERLEEILQYKSSTEVVHDLKEKMNITEPSLIVGENIEARTSDPALREMENLKVISSHKIEKLFKRTEQDELYATELLTLILNDGTEILLEPEFIEDDGYKFIKLVVKNIKIVTGE